MTPAVPDPTVEVLDALGRYLRSRAATAKALGREDREWLDALILLNKARATAPDTLRDRLQALCDAAMRNNWHLGAEAVSVTIAQVLAVVGEGS